MFPTLLYPGNGTQFPEQLSGFNFSTVPDERRGFFQHYTVNLVWERPDSKYSYIFMDPPELRTLQSLYTTSLFRQETHTFKSKTDKQTKQTKQTRVIACLVHIYMPRPGYQLYTTHAHALPRICHRNDLRIQPIIYGQVPGHRWLHLIS